MLTAIPGCNHLKIWQGGPEDATADPLPPPTTTTGPLPCNERVVHRLIAAALEVAAGRKPPASLSTSRYSPAVVRHLSVRRKVYAQRGNASIRSIHAHRCAPGTLNLAGACSLAGCTYAYAAKIQVNPDGDIRLESLRIL